MKTALIGGVGSTRLALDKLLQHGFTPHCVYGFEPEDSTHVSGYVSLADASRACRIGYQPFRRINDHAEDIAEQRYDLIFVIGLSQLVSEQIIASARLGCIGFHPTLLPRGRGRAPLAWLVLEQQLGAANLFLIEGSADSGPIFKQVPFSVAPEDDAAMVESKALQALATAFDHWLPELARGVWDPHEQDETLVTEYGVRKPEDGWIDWHAKAVAIDRLIKAAAHPHPGAYSFVGDKRLIVWSSEPDMHTPIRGVIGRVLKIDENDAPLVQTGDGLLRLTRYAVEDGSQLKVGMLLGFYHELELYRQQREIYRLQQELAMIKERIGL
jgi:methionyl-tRNA formyltransferase